MFHLVPSSSNQNSPSNDECDQQATLSNDLGTWNGLEMDLMNSSNEDELEVAILKMHSYVLHNPRLMESIGMKAVISAVTMKRNKSTDLWGPKVSAFLICLQEDALRLHSYVLLYLKYMKHHYFVTFLHSITYSTHIYLSTYRVHHIVYL
jgi:hypothetical protein